MGASPQADPPGAGPTDGNECAACPCPLTLVVSDNDEEALGLPVLNQWRILQPLTFVRREIARFIYFRVFDFLSRPCLLRLTRAITRLMRWIHPVPRVGRWAIPLRAKDLRNALERVEDLNGAEQMSPRLPMGENVLAIDWPRRHAEEREVLEQVLDHNHDKDHLRIRKIVRDRVKKALPTERSELRKLNIARFCEDVALDVAGRYLGIGDLCEREDLRPIVRRLASQVFQAPVHGSIEERDARLAGSRMAGLAKHYVDEAVDQFECCQKHDEDWTITDRLLHAVARENVPSISAHRRNWVTRNMATLAVFGSVTTARAMTQAIYQIHLYPERWKIARHAAKTYEDVAVKFDGPAEEHPVDAVSELKTAREDLLMVIFEALRWHPMLPVLGVRTAIRDTLLAPGNDARTPVRAGTKVLPVLMAAMHDGETFRHPECFCPKARNKDDYLHFGAGPHECVGRHMAEAMLIEIAAAFFTDDLIGARYRKTTAIEYDGPAVNALWFQPC